MKIVISGCKGFIGSKLTKTLDEKKNFEIKCLDIRSGQDVTNIKIMNKLDKFDVFIHLAAKSYVPESFKNPHSFYDVNMNGTLNALELCRKYNGRMIFISSYVYGKPEYLPINEEHPLHAFNPYAQSKLIGEMLCEGYHRDFNVPSTILRPFNIYGNGQSKSFLIPTILSQIKNGNSTIHLKDPNPRRDYVHIDDVVNAILLSIYNNHTGIIYYNVASGKSYSVFEVTEIIKKVLEPTQEINFTFSPNTVRKNEVLETVGSYDKINRELGWKPEISFYDGITRCL